MPISAQNFSRDVPLIAPVIAHVASYFINKCLIIWLIIHNITTVKVWPYKRLINCNKSLSWKFIGEVYVGLYRFVGLQGWQGLQGLGLSRFIGLCRVMQMRSTSNFWCQRFIMISLICDIVLSESQIRGGCYSSWKAIRIPKCQKCRLICER